MKKEEKSSTLAEIATIKKDLMMMRIKSSSGELVVAKEYKNKKKAIARLFTKINSNKKVAKA